MQQSQQLQYWKENVSKSRTPLTACYARLVPQNEFSILAHEKHISFSKFVFTAFFHDIQKMHFIDNKTTIFTSLTHIRLHVIIRYVHRRLTGIKKHNFSYITCVWQRDNISEGPQDNSISAHANPSANRKVKYNAFPNQKYLRNQPVPTTQPRVYILCWVYHMWFFSHQQKELFIKGKLYSFSLLEVYSLLGSSWPESNWQRI